MRNKMAINTFIFKDNFIDERMANFLRTLHSLHNQTFFKSDVKHSVTHPNLMTDISFCQNFYYKKWFARKSFFSSTLSSGFSAMSAILWSDFLKPCFPKVSELTATLITKSTGIYVTEIKKKPLAKLSIARSYLFVLP